MCEQRTKVNHKIRIVDLELFAHHGVYEQEQRDGQKFLVCAELICARASQLDKIETAVNYADVCACIADFMKSRTFCLIETVSDQLALLLLEEFPLLSRVEIEVKKPDAPLAFPFQYVSAVSARERHIAFIGLGSNLGDRESNLNAALCELNGGGIRIGKVSSFRQTKAYGNTDQPDFLNAVCEIETVLEPLELLNALQTIEQKNGRVRKEKWGPRTLDLDILFYDDLILNASVLTIPHPDLHNRRFVLEPLCEIAPDWIHPVWKKRVVEL